MNGHDLLKYLESDRAARRLNGLTVSTYRTACRSVMAALPSGLDTRLESLDLDQAQQRFESSKAAEKLAPATRSTYVSSFKAAVRAALVDLPEAAGNERAPLVVHTFPIRHDQEIQLELPRDITRSEAERLSAFIHTLVIERT